MDRARWTAVAVTIVLAAMAAPAEAESESRSVSGFDEVVLELPAELQIEQGSREGLTIEAEPAALRKITSEVSGHRLRIAMAPGRLELRQPIRLRLQLRQLRAFESRGAGTITAGAIKGDSLSLGLSGGGSIRIATLDAQSLATRIAGAGEVSIGGGQVKRQSLTIGGIGSYAAPSLRSDDAEVSIDGSGQARLAAASRLDVRIAGVGQVRYRGDPVVTRSISGVGTVEKD